MRENKQTKQIRERILETYEQMRDQVEASVELISDRVMLCLDPHSVTPLLVRHLAVMDIRQMTRAILRKQTELTDELDASTEDLFGAALQFRYPAERNGQFVYVRREHLTLEEREQNEQALRAEAQAKIQHADALRAETEYLRSRGHFREAA